MLSGDSIYSNAMPDQSILQAQSLKRQYLVRRKLPLSCTPEIRSQVLNMADRGDTFLSDVHAPSRNTFEQRSLLGSTQQY